MDWEAFYQRFREPDFVPGYEIQQRLGGGAFGEVYKARKHSIGKAYAIKFLKVDDEAQREAIERELEQVRHFAAIDHPNLVTIEDLGAVLDVPYLVMGYAGEETLARRLREGPLEPRLALLFFVQACRGVLALHDRRLVHFDLKPSNVFLKGDIARVGDYGLSKLMVDGRMTLSFGRGTPHYMAPEMIRSRADHRADVYSLGVILYETLAGRLPFESDVPGTLVLREDDVPPEFPEAFPADLRPVVERCLRLDPADRYASVSELLGDLGQTARPGDSVVLERVPAAAAPARPAFAPHGARAAAREGEGEAARARPPSAGTPPAGTPLAGTPPAGTRSAAAGRSGSSSDPLRQTAAELARGAVEVARGVWQGLRSGSEAAPPGAPPARLAGPPPGRSTGPDADPGPGAGGNGAAPRAVAPSAGPGVALADGPSAEAAGRAGTAAAERPAAEGPAAGERASGAGARGAAVGTIPVPPRVGGGVLGTVWATVGLAVEVLVSLLSGLLRQVFRGFGAAGDTFLRSSGSLSGRLLRLALFLLLLALVGAAITLVALLFLA